jgi:hypothetical protein
MVARREDLPTPSGPMKPAMMPAGIVSETCRAQLLVDSPMAQGPAPSPSRWPRCAPRRGLDILHPRRRHVWTHSPVAARPLRKRTSSSEANDGSPSSVRA